LVPTFIYITTYPIVTWFDYWYQLCPLASNMIWLLVPTFIYHNIPKSNMIWLLRTTFIYHNIPKSNMIWLLVPTFIYHNILNSSNMIWLLITTYFYHNLPIGSNLILVPFDLLVTTHLSQLLPTNYCKRVKESTLTFESCPLVAHTLVF